MGATATPVTKSGAYATQTAETYKWDQKRNAGEYTKTKMSRRHMPVCGAGKPRPEYNKTKAEYRADAVKKLKDMRKSPVGNGPFIIDSIREMNYDLKMAGLTYRNIGTSEAEVKGLEKRGYKAEASFDLSLAKKDPKSEFAALFIDEAKNEAAKAGVSINDLGTPEADIRLLEKQGYRASALSWYAYLCNGTEVDPESFVKRVIDDSKKAGITLAEIGTSEAELKQLAKECNLYAARQCLKRARDLSANPKDHLDVILMTDNIDFARKHLEKAGAKPEDIGTSEKELQKLPNSFRVSLVKFLEKIRHL